MLLCILPLFTGAPVFLKLRGGSLGLTLGLQTLHSISVLQVGARSPEFLQHVYLPSCQWCTWHRCSKRTEAALRSASLPADGAAVEGVCAGPRQPVPGCHHALRLCGPVGTRRAGHQDPQVSAAQCTLGVWGGRLQACPHCCRRCSAHAHSHLAAGTPAGLSSDLGACPPRAPLQAQRCVTAARCARAVHSPPVKCLHLRYQRARRVRWACELSRARLWPVGGEGACWCWPPSISPWLAVAQPNHQCAGLPLLGGLPRSPSHSIPPGAHAQGAWRTWMMR